MNRRKTFSQNLVLPVLAHLEKDLRISPSGQRFMVKFQGHWIPIPASVAYDMTLRALDRVLAAGEVDYSMENLEAADWAKNESNMYPVMNVIKETLRSRLQVS